MSVNININKMSYAGGSYAERAQADKRKINRLLSVREQSNVLSQNLLKKTRTAKEQELKRLQQIKEKELSEWKRKTQCHIQKEIDDCIGSFGNAHIAAVDASCEEDESLREKRDEQDLMAAMRGRKAMLGVQRERERDIENKLLKKKRSQQKTIGIQADFLAQRGFSKNLINNSINKSSGKQNNIAEADVSEEEEINEMYSTKPNQHRHTEQSYNPQNYTSHSVDSSNNNDSENDFEELEKDENSSEVEFNQITNLLKHRLPHDASDDDIVEIQSSDSDLIEPSNIEIPKRVTIRQTSPKKNSRGILKSPAKSAAQKNIKQSSKANKNKTSADNRVRYVDFGNKYETSYIPDKNLIVRSEKSKTNARENAQIQTDDDLIARKINDDILKQLTELRSQEALEKEKIRRDYERLRLELDELSKQEQEAKVKLNTQRNLSRDQLLRREEARKKKMNEAAENAMKRNIITCPPVDRTNEKSTRQKSNEINVAVLSQPFNNFENTSVEPIKRTNSEINNLVRIEKLKDLLEKINHQKRLLMNEIEKSDDVPGPDLEKVMKCIEKLEAEKVALSSNETDDKLKLKKLEELNEREKKIQEREIRLENKLRELFRKQQKEPILKSSSSSSASEKIPSEESSSTDESNKKIVQPPVEIIIKVQQPKSQHSKKSRKSYKCIDTLSRGPGKVYPKTPIKKKKSSSESDIEAETLQPPIIINTQHQTVIDEKSQQETQTSPIPLDAPKPILKNSNINQISIPSKLTKENILRQTAESEDFSQSTVYRELPREIHLITKDAQNKSQKKLNPLLMDYITRVLGMNKNFENQLNVDVSSITTPGTSTINTSENVSVSTGQASFDQDRLNRLQKFIDDNHSFISEINESLERVELQKKQEKEKERLVEGIWHHILRKNKPSSNLQPKPSSSIQSVPSSKKINQPQIPQKEQPKSTQSTTIRSQSVPVSSAGTSPKQIPKRLQRPRISEKDMKNVSKYIESQMLNNYTEYTANCERRIAELTEMMEKVRQDKLKLIENSLSSNEFNNFTEYKEIAQTTAKSNGNNVTAPNIQQQVNPSVTGSSDPKDSPSNRDDPPSEEINNILQFQTRPFGISKDSGISISRPVTSSDFRDSPADGRVTSEETTNNNNNNNLFQPILKDIPKVPRFKVTGSDGETQPINGKDTSLRQQQQDEKIQKKQKPPLSLKSPVFEKQQHEPHELSTIVEIETPTASKNNLIQDEVSGVGALHSFPNFDEYAKRNGNKQTEISTISNLDGSAVKNNNIKPTETSFPDLNDLKNALPDLNVKTFIGHDNLTLADLSNDMQQHQDVEEQKDIPSNDSSLIDIMEELKKRQIFEESFHIYYEDEAKNDDLGTGCERDEKTTPTTTHILIAEPNSPKRKQPAQSRIIKKTPKNNIEIESAKTPAKKKQNQKQHEHSPTRSNDTLSGIQEIEKDLQAEGLGWAASTLKRTEESNKKKQGNSSSSSEKYDSIKIEMEFETSSSSSDGRPLNLRDFLRRELLTRSKNDKYLSDDSSISARFIQRMLDGTNNLTSCSSSNDPKSDSSQNARLRTSTPVRKSSENLVKTCASSQIFAGGESVSTVKDSTDASCHHDKSEKSKSL